VSDTSGSVLSSNAILTVLPASPNCTPAPAGIVGWWRAEGDANDAVGGNSGVIGGNVAFVPGEVGEAFHYDGLTSAVTVPASSNLAVRSFTIEAWISPEDTSHPRPIVEYATATGPGYIHFWYDLTASPGGGIGAPGALYGLVRDPGGASLQVSSAAGILSSNQWSHVAFTFDYSARTAFLYLNGVNVASNASPVVVQPLTSLPVNLGYSPPQSTDLLAGTRHLGKLDEVSIYNRALSAAQIQSIYGASNAGKCPLLPSTNCVPAPAGLISWWPAEGDPRDITGTNSGTLVNGVTFAPGAVGQAFSFNGIDQVVQVPDSPSLNPTNGLTLEGWIYAQAFSSSDAVSLAGKDNPYSYRQYLLGMAQVSNNWVFRAHVGLPGGVTLVNGATPLQTQTWYHVAMTYDGASLRLYVNGTLDTSLPATGAIVTSSVPLLIGGSVPGPWNFNGRIDELSLYGRALSLLEIQAIHTAGGAGKCRGGLPPLIMSQPTGQTVSVGGTANFSVGATGTAPLSYQWLFNGTNLVGQTGSSLVLTNIQPANGGNYSVLVSNGVSSVRSSNALLTVLLSTNNCVPAPSGLVSWWRGEGNANDSIGNNNGTVMNSVYFEPGKVGQCFHFVSGPDPRVYVPDNPTLQLTNSLTMEAWIKINFGYWIVNRGDDVAGEIPYGMTLFGVTDTHLRFIISASANSHAELDTAALPTNVWLHIAGTLDDASGDMRIYVNGQIVAETNTAIRAVCRLTGANHSLCIGNSAGTAGFPFDGWIDEVSLYSRALSQAEIQAIYNAGSAGKCTSAIAPTITAQPAGLTVNVGDTAAFSVTAAGSQPLSYQWLFNGTNLVGQTGTSLVLSNVQPANGGNYSVLVSNVVSSVLSSNALLTVLLPSSNCVPAPSGLVSWWRGEGNANDSIGTNNGTVMNSVYFEPGKVGQCFHFVSGPNPRVYVPDNPTLQLTHSLTMEAWIKINFGYWIVNRGDDVIDEIPYGMTLVGVTDTHLKFMISASPSSHAMLETAPLPTNVWLHIAGTLDDASGDMRIYVNGQIIAETNTAIRAVCPLTGANRSLCIGNSAGTAGFPFDGWIDEVSLYSRALSQADIQAIYNAGSAGKCTSAVALTITAQPAGLTVNLGDTAAFNVTATGSQPLSYQWLFNGSNLVGQTGTSLVLSNVQPANGGNYSVLVSNVVSSVLSSNALLTVVLPSTNCVPPPSGLVSWWRGEGNGNDSAGTNNGTLLNGVSFAAGMVGQAFRFVSGPNPKVYVADNPTLQLTNSLSIEGWIKPNFGWTLLSRGDDTLVSDPYTLGFTSVSDLRLIFRIVDASGQYLSLTAPESLATNVWVHVAATLDGGAGIASIYVNGQVVAQTNTVLRPKGPLTGANPSLCIGNAPGTTGFPFDGLIDEIALYSRALSQTEIQSIYNAGSAGKCVTATAPSITSQPASQTTSVGGTATFNVTASGSPPLGYQWLFNGTNLVGQTGTSLVLSNAQPANAGIYSVLVSNMVGSVLSSNALLTVLLPTNNCVPAPAGLVGWWRGEGNANDSADGNNGVITGNVTFVTGEVGQAFNFDGLTSAVTIPASSNLTVQSLTIEAWIFPPDVSHPRPIVEYAGPTGPGDVQLWSGTQGYGVGVPGAVEGVLRGTGSTALALYTPGGLVVSNQWNHVAMTFDYSKQTAVLYVNGLAAGSNTSSGAFLPVTSVPVNLGYRPPGSSDGLAGTRHLGGLDEVSIYNRALSAAELLAIYNAGSAGKCLPPASTNCVAAPSGMVSWWRAEGSAADSVGGNDGVVSGNVSFVTGEVGEAFSFDGISSAVTVPASSNLAVQSFTIEAWVEPTDVSSPRPIVEYAGPSGLSSVAFWLGSGAAAASPGALNAALRDSSNGALECKTATGIVASNQWNHVAVSFDNASRTMLLYVNGVNVGSNSSPVSIQPQTFVPVNLGHRPIGSGEIWPGRTLAGGLDEVSIYNRVLSASEVQSIYRAGSAGKCLTATAPTITAQPASQIVNVTGTAFFSVAATGTSPLSYQWEFNGTNLTGQTTTSLVLSNVQPNNGGNYGVRVSNSVGSVLSSNALLTVLLPLTNCAPAPTGIVGWWRAEGDATDAAGGNNGIIGGNVTFVPGEVGEALHYDGATSAVTVPASSNLAVRSFTIEAWISPEDISHPRPILEYAGTAAGYIHFWYGLTASPGGGVGAPGALYGLVRDPNGGALQVSSAAGLLSSNQWSHVAFTFDYFARTAVLYLNGVNVGSNVSSVAVQPLTSLPVNLGFSPPQSTDLLAGTRHLGKLDEVSIYNRALSPAELLAIYNAGSAGKCPSGLAPTITSQPADQTALVGGTATFNVKATGAAPLTYQWRFNGTNLLGQTSAWLTLSNVQVSNAGAYAALVGNQAGSVLSSNAILTVIPPPTNCVPAPSGLVGWWPGEGNADDEVGGNNGIIGGNLTFVPGEVGQAFNFDGTTSAITVPASSSLTVHSLTIEAWVAPYDISHPRPIVEYAGRTGPGYVQLWYGITAAPGGAVGAPGALYGLLRDPGGAALQVGSSAGLLASNQWSHVALTFDYTARIARLYVNGVNVASNGSPVAVQPLTSVPVNLGYRPPQSSELLAGTRHLGKLDEVSIYNRVLSAGEVQSIYQAGSSGKCPVAPQPGCVPPGAGVVSWWRAEGNAQDAVGPNNGALMNGTGFTSGKVGLAFAFNGVNQFVQVPDAPSLDPTNSLTMEMWVNVTGYSSNDGVVIVGKDNPYAVRQYLLSLGNVSGQWVFRPHVGVPGGLRYFNGTMPIQLNTWYHVAMTYDGSSLKLFVNGILDGSLNVTGPIVTSAEPLLIGGSVPGPWYFNGSVDELTLYNRALSQAEIQAIYEAGSAGKCIGSVRPDLANISAGTVQNQPLSLPAQNLLALAAPSGIPLALSSVSGTSTNSGTVSIQTNCVVYTPPVDFVGADRFTYTANGAQSGPASAYVLVQVRRANQITGQSLPATAIPAGFQLKVTGTPGSTYTLERAASVSGPWTVLNPVTVGPDGLGSIIDTNPPAPAAFYRTVPQ
jgi:hypothetical protein